MEKIIIITGICVFTAVICRILDGKAAEFGLILKMAAAVAVMISVITVIVPVAERIEALYRETGISDKYMSILLKSIGICYITQLASDVCRDSGENALAVQAEAAGKVSLLILALPLLEETAELVYKLIY